MRRSRRFILLNLLAAAILYGAHAFGQASWSPPGARWHYAVSGEGTDGALEYWYEKDTTIDSITAKKINSTFYGRMYYYTPIHGVSAYKQQVTLMRGSVLFVNVPGTAYFDTAVVFSALPGQSWLAPRRYVCQNRRIVTVTDTGSVLLNSMRFKSITLKYTVKDLQHTVTYTTTMVEKIYAGHFRAPCFDMFAMSCDNPVPQTNCETATFMCYTDSSSLLYNPWQVNCSSFLAVARQQGNELDMPYPNPFIDRIRINAPHEGEKWHMYSVLGENHSLPSYFKDGQLNIETEALPPGIYVLSIAGRPPFTMVKVPATK